MKKLTILVLGILMAGIMAVTSACSSAATRAPTAPGTTSIPMTTTRPQTYPAVTTAPAMTSRPQTAAPTTGKLPPAGNYPTTTSSGPNIGLAVGGAKDIANFRENIDNNYLPLPSDVTYEGLFYDYYFDTGATQPANKLFSPSYSTAVSRDPISGQTDYYLSVGLNSGLKESDFQRKKLNLVIVLDNSGSMGEYYTQYYYDNSGKQIDVFKEEGGSLNKMDSANQSVNAILDQLNNDDYFSIVTFNNQAHLQQNMTAVGNVDLRKVKNAVLNISPGGSTNLDAGLDLATSQLRNLKNLSTYEYENRIIVLTDAQPNTGDINTSNFLKTMQSNANSRIYTTFIGIGVDFNSSLIEQISKVKGCNYYSVHSPREFRARVNDEFDYMVTPLVFNVSLNFQSTGWRIEKVFGSPQADEASGRLMYIDTLFAAKSDASGQVKGGLVLLKLKKTSSGNAAIKLSTTFEDRAGHTDGEIQTINLESITPEYFDNTGIRKGVLLTRYAALLKNWMIEQRQYANYRTAWTPCVREDTGIILPVEYSQWERQSTALTVSSDYRSLFRNFSRYFQGEINAIGDNDLQQEMDILYQLQRS